MTSAHLGAIAQSKSGRQFVKFCIIGFTSTVIDFAGLNLFAYLGLHWILAKILAFCLAVTNGFVWNSLWTFRGQGKGSRHERYAKFVLVNIVGLSLNILIMKSVFFAATGQLVMDSNPPQLLMNGANIIAVGVVVIWNFTANKRWTFGGKRTG